MYETLITRSDIVGTLQREGEGETKVLDSGRIFISRMNLGAGPSGAAVVSRIAELCFFTSQGG